MDPESLLEQTGLTRTEARVYLCLLGQSPLSAAAVADQAGTSRSAVYVVLRSLVEKGFVEGGTGYSTKYRPVSPQRALTGQLDRDRQELAAREQSVDQVLPALADLFEPGTPGDGEIVEVLRTPKVVGERFDRLQAEARRTIDVVVRGPMEVGGPNEAEITALARGVRARAVYDRAAIADPAVARYLGRWASAGEEARVYPGELPMKFAVFDQRAVIMPLAPAGQSGVVAVIVRSTELAAALEILFGTLWAGAEPLESALATAAGTPGGGSGDPTGRVPAEH